MGAKPWYLCRGKFAAMYIQTFHFGLTNEEHYFSAIKEISGTIDGDSSLQDRGVAHYLLSLLFILVSLPFSFYLCVPYQKYQKYLLPCFLLLLWVPMKIPSCVT